MKRQFKLNKNKSNGFTLIELIVAVAVFSVLLVAVTGIGAAVIRAQRKVLAMQVTAETLRYILETVSKEVRMSSVNTPSGEGLLSLNVTNHDIAPKTFNYSFSNGEFRLNGQRLTPNSVTVTGGFYVKKDASLRRAMVTITMRASYKGSKAEAKSDIYVQTTIGPRPN